ncbi:MAG: hypothetical protein CMG77_02600 [Marinimicrobium sp.]|nr:hypothetical protein [Marinimicrobium sp.]
MWLGWVTADARLWALIRPTQISGVSRTMDNGRYGCLTVLGGLWILPENEHGPAFMDTARRQLDHLIEQEELAPADYQRAATLLGLYPSLPRWQRFLDHLLLWLSALALGFALLFFIAYNWTELGHLGRFALVELALLIAVSAYFWKGGRGLAAKAALFAAALVVGGLLALFGQTYQTGADPWQLFFTWSLMILPWALIARLPALWVLVIGLWNLATMLYHGTFGSVWILTGDTSLAWALLVINTLSLIGWELAARRLTWLDTGWAQRLIAAGVGMAATILALIGSSDTLISGELLIYALVLAAIYGVYRYLKPDLFMLAGGCLSVIVVIDGLFIAHTDLQEDGVFFLLSAITIGSTTALVKWLIHLNRLMHHEPEH